jgi:hypothetical protein
MNIAGHAEDALPGLFVGGVYRCVFRGQDKAGLKNLEEYQAKKADHADCDRHFRIGETGMAKLWLNGSFH